MRSKEIETAAFNYVNSDAVPAENMHLSYGDFINGAKWADEHPNFYNDEKYHTVKVSCLDELNRKAALYDAFIDKACKWLKENIDLVAMDTFNVRSGYHEIVMMNFFEKKFRQAMEEE